MRTRILFSLSLLLSASPAFAIQTKPVELNLPAGAASVTVEDEEGATLSFRLPGGKEQREENLGQEFAPFTFGSKSDATVETQDIDGDGQAEVIARTVVPGGDGALYVFRFDAEKARFVPALGLEGDEFLYVNPKANVSVGNTGTISVKSAKATAAYQVKADRFTKAKL